MDFRRQTFKLDDSELEISLERIESLYQVGRIQKTDNVYICDSPGAPFLAYKLEILQQLYGHEFPFRRIINLNPNSNRIYDFSSSGSSEDEDGKEEMVEERTRKKSVRLNDEKNVVVMFEPDSPATQKYTLLPLFQKSEEAKDLLFGKDLDNAYIELRRMAPLPWQNKPEIVKYFKDFEKNSENLVKCELCNFTPFNQQFVIQHLFGDEHRKQLAKCGASKKSLGYWHNRFLEANPTLALAKQRASSLKNRVPLIFDPKDTSLGKRNNFRSGKKLKLLIAKIDETALNKHGEFFNLFFEEIGYPAFCPMCGENTKFARFPSSVVTHLTTDSHLKKLKQYGYYEIEYSFWCQILHQFQDSIMKRDVVGAAKTTISKKQAGNKRVVSNAVAEQKGLAIQKARIWKNRIPLIFDPNDNKLGKRKSWKNGNALKKCIEKVDEKKVNEKDGFFDSFFEAIGTPNCCALCNKRMSTEPYSILTHIVSDDHYNKLKEHGFYEIEYSFWCQILNDLKKEVKKNTSTPSNIVPLLGKCENVEDFLDIKKREGLLNRLENGLNNVDKSALNGSEKLKAAMKKAGVMECGFECEDSLVIPQVASTILEHCLRSPHRQALLSHGFVAEDFEFWMNELGVHKAITSKKDFQKNVPRIPLIDIGDTRGTSSAAKREECVKKLNRMWESVTAKNFNRAADSLMLYNKNGTCYACRLPNACFSNPVAMATHVFSPEHKSHMIKRGVRASDVRLWTKLLSDAMNRVTPPPPPTKPSVATVAPLKHENVSLGEPKLQQNQVKSMTVTKPPAQNRPDITTISLKQQKRVPLLDKPLETHTLIKDENEIDEIWKKMKMIVRNPVKRTCYVTIMGSNKYYCTTCYQNFEDGYGLPFSGRLVHHVFSYQHLKNLKPFGISSEDLNHWKMLFDETLVAKTYKQQAIPFLYANIDNHDAVKYRKLSQNVVLKKFEELREKVENFNVAEFDELFRPLVHRHDRRVCTWCNFSFNKSSSILAKHVVDEKHVENVLKFCLVSEEDFREWFDMFKFIQWVREEKRLEMKVEQEENLKKGPPEAIAFLDVVESTANAVTTIKKGVEYANWTAKGDGGEYVLGQQKGRVAKPAPVVKTAVVQPITSREVTKTPICDSKIVDNHRIPLTRSSHYKDQTWPTIDRLKRIRSIRFRVEVDFSVNTLCQFCKCPLNNANLLNHVFSVKHMYNASIHKARFSPEEFSFYDNFLTYRGNTFSSTMVTMPPIWVSRTFSSDQDIYRANQKHISLLPTLDRNKLDTSGCYFLKPTGCPTCNVWLLTQSEVAEHLVGYEHNQKHAMRKDAMEKVISSIKLCQKPKPQTENNGLCVLM